MKKKLDEKTIVQWAKECRDLLAEKKGEKISLLDLRKVNSYLDYFLICTGTSRVHLRSLSRDIDAFFSERSLKARSISDPSSDWIILDFSEIVVHLFTAESRSYYDLDRLWSDAVKL